MASLIRVGFGGQVYQVRARGSHDVCEAQRLLAASLRALELRRQELAAKPKNRPAKPVLAW